VLLIHGSPGTGDVFQGLTPLLASHFRVIAPDLPGFGDSTRGIPDYSFRAHAGYVLALLRQLHVGRAHWVGFSMGGGVILSAEDLDPGRVTSLTMLSAIGVQEEELTGSYWTNHALHFAQLAILQALVVDTPHFGWLDQFPLNIEYARNFYDSDQRPLRAILQKYRGPMLILHGARDPQVPLAAALEHHRLVPQSELEVYEWNHFMTFQAPELYSERLVRFLQDAQLRAERGERAAPMIGNSAR
jgi:pimeloyl-ACP methyl ester carboxylesterase